MRLLRKRLALLVRPKQRHLLRALINASFEVTEQKTLLGMAWSLIMPLFFTFVMFFLFRGRFSDGDTTYVAFIMIGVSTVGFFINATGAMMMQLVHNRDLVLNTTVPRELLFLTAMSNALLKYAVELGLVLVVSIVIASPWWPALPLLVPLAAALCALTLGFGFVLALIVPATRDILYLWVLVSRVLLFATPVFYSLDRIAPLAAKVVYFLNPLSPFLVAMRKILLGSSSRPFVESYVHSLAVGFGALAIGYLVFLRFEHAAVERS